MYSYDNWKAYNYRDDELGEIGDEEEREDEDMMKPADEKVVRDAAEAFMRYKDKSPSMARHDTDFFYCYLLGSLGIDARDALERFRDTVHHIEDCQTAERNEKWEEPRPYIDEKFNASTEKYGKGW